MENNTLWIIPSLIASLAAVGLEYVYRARWFDNYTQGIWLLVPAGLVIQVMLFYSYRDAPRLLVAWSAFFAVNAVARLLISGAILHEPLTLLTLLAIGLIVTGAIIMRY